MRNRIKSTGPGRTEGTDGADIIIGVEGLETLVGGDGDDILKGFGGDDLLLGEGGNDTAQGGEGNDTFFGGDGDDLSNWSIGDGSDDVFGGDGEDTVKIDMRGLNTIPEPVSFTLSGRSSFVGVPGAVLELAEIERLLLFLSGGDDLITLETEAGLTAGDVSVFGGKGNDVIESEISQADTLNGGAGDDTIRSLASITTLEGGQGNDVIEVSPAFSGRGTLFVDGGLGRGDRALIGNDILDDDIRRVELTSEAGGVTDITVTDSFGRAPGLLVKRVEKVTLPTGDETTEVIATGVKGISSFDFSGPSAVDFTSGVRAQNVTGTRKGDAIRTGGGNDTVKGGGGRDTIDSGPGRDSVNGGAGNDSVTAGGGNDEVLGGAGNDTIRGGFGNDEVQGGKGKDSLDGGKGADFLSGGDGDDFIFGNSGNDGIFGGDGADTLLGGAGDDVITSDGSGADSVNGMGGNDTLIFNNDGAHTLKGGGGVDRFVFELDFLEPKGSPEEETDGTVVIADFDAATEKLEISFPDVLTRDNFDFVQEGADVRITVLIPELANVDILMQNVSLDQLNTDNVLITGGF